MSRDDLHRMIAGEELDFQRNGPAGFNNYSMTEVSTQFYGDESHVPPPCLGARRADGTFQVLGRVPGAEARGCALAMDEFLQGAKA